MTTFTWPSGKTFSIPDNTEGEWPDRTVAEAARWIAWQEGFNCVEDMLFAFLCGHDHEIVNHNSDRKEGNAP
jgi:hypothetical protein